MRETGAHMWYRVALYMVRTNVSRHLLHPYCLEMVSPDVAPNEEPSAIRDRYQG